MLQLVGASLPMFLCDPMTAGIVEAVVVAVGALALLWRGEGVVVSFQAAVRLGVELGLERGKLLCDAKEASDLHAQDHPNYICQKKQTACYNT